MRPLCSYVWGVLELPSLRKEKTVCRLLVQRRPLGLYELPILRKEQPWDSSVLRKGCTFPTTRWRATVKGKTANGVAKTSESQGAMEPVPGMTVKPKRDYQANVRRRCNSCGGHYKAFEKQPTPGQLDCFCTTCHRMITFRKDHLELNLWATLTKRRDQCPAYFQETVLSRIPRNRIKKPVIWRDWFTLLWDGWIICN